MIARVAAICAVVTLPLMAACSGERESFGSQHQRQRGVRTLEPFAKLSEADPASPSVQPQPELAAPAAPAPEPAPAEEPAAAQPEKPVRNLSTELETMLGNPTSCLAPRAAAEAPSRVDISLSVQVMPSGAVSRGEVSAPGLTLEERDCLRTRLEALHFAQPIENAPFTVKGSIRLDRGS